MVEKVRKLYPKLTERDVKSTSMGASGADVQLSQAAFELFPFRVECKSRAIIPFIYQVMDQAISHNQEGYPMAVLKGNGKTPLVVMFGDDFFGYIDSLNKLRGK